MLPLRGVVDLGREGTQVAGADTDLLDGFGEDPDRAQVLAAVAGDDVDEQLGGMVQLFAVSVAHHRDQPLAQFGKYTDNDAPGQGTRTSPELRR